MASPPAERRSKADLLALVRAIPSGRVASTDTIANKLGVIPSVVATLIGGLTIDERDTAPWYRVVAKGGAIGRGPHRDQQFAKLVREGVPVSPAGIVQDMARVAVTNLVPLAAGVGLAKGGDPEPALTRPSEVANPAPNHAPSRSRGMKDRPN